MDKKAVPVFTVLVAEGGRMFIQFNPETMPNTAKELCGLSCALFDSLGQAMEKMEEDSRSKIIKLDKE